MSVHPPTSGPVQLGPGAHAVLRPVDGAVITGGLLYERRRTNADVSIPDGHTRLVEAGNFHNLRLAAGTADGAYRNTLPFLDSDLYKWLEAVAWLRSAGTVPAAEATRLDGWVDDAVALLTAAQQPDGYLQSYFQVVRPDEHFIDLEWGHELYCAGHLIQAAVAHVRATGRTDLLAVATRVADHIADRIGPGFCGHPEIETALVELYRATGADRHLALARQFLDARGHRSLRADRFGSEYWQDHLPVRTADAVTGHAVRQLYLLAGVADVYLETGETALLDAAERLWTDLVTSKTYLTGGLGAHHTDEAFGEAYELPSERAYAETCAAIASIQFSLRMLLATGRAKYADLLERTLYNGFLSGVSLSGDHYFYANPLRAGDGGPARTRWFTCACCPPNVMRLLASAQHYLAAQDENGLLLHQFVAGEYAVSLAAGPIALRVETDYPWHEEINIHIGQSTDRPWTLTLRVPAWATEYRAHLNGEPVAEQPVDGWLRINRRWSVGDAVRLDLAMPARLTAPHPRVDALRGSLAIERGPLVYCVEALDQPHTLDDLVLDPDAPLTTGNRPDLLGGSVTVTATARVRTTEQERWWPYGPTPVSTVLGKAVRLTAVPYHLWGNRGPGAMRVWLPTS
ncbi:MAG TPA: beta-L-arabinofuranosidase domain-containing protein [Pseudonocardiaceae bacterium]|jgi:hypothetical protein|nr:beta-L-arabinofuranosidase domain-containing protein [Pseudonocardiaceae bacterium]